MRHGNKINHLGRTYSHRKAMLSNMAASLIMHKRITTTLAKAKELRTFIEPLITKAKNDSTHNRRQVFAKLQSKEAVTELFNEVSSKVAERNGGYTRILKIGETRVGDNAEMCMIELVDYNENMLKDTTSGKKKRSRRGRSSGSTTKTKAAVADTAASKVEETESAIVEATEQVEESTADTTEDVKDATDTEGDAGEADASEEEKA